MDQQGNRQYQTNQMMGTPPAPAGQSPQTTGLASSAQMTQHHQQQQQTLQQQLQHIRQQQQQQLLQQLQQQLQNISEIEQVTDFENHSLLLAGIEKIMKADEDVRMSNLQSSREALDKMDQQGNRPYETNQMMGTSPASAGQSPQTTGLVSSAQMAQDQLAYQHIQQQQQQQLPQQQLTLQQQWQQLRQQLQQLHQKWPQQQQTLQQLLQRLQQLQQQLPQGQQTLRQQLQFIHQQEQQQRQQELHQEFENILDQYQELKQVIAFDSLPFAVTKKIMKTNEDVCISDLQFSRETLDKMDQQGNSPYQTNQMMGTSPAQSAQTTGLASSAQMAHHQLAYQNIHQQQQQTLQQQQQLQNIWPNQTNQMMGTSPAPAGQSPQTTGLASSAQMAQHQLAYQQIQQQQQLQQQLQFIWPNQYQEIEQVTGFENHSLPLARINTVTKADEDVWMSNLPSSWETLDKTDQQGNRPYQTNQMMGISPAPAGQSPQTTGLVSSAQMAQHQLAYQQIHQQQQQQLQQQLQNIWPNQYQEIEQVTDFENHGLPLARMEMVMKADDFMMSNLQFPRETLDKMDQQGNRRYQNNQMMGTSLTPAGQSPQTTGPASSAQMVQNQLAYQQIHQQKQQQLQNIRPNQYQEIEQVTDFQNHSLPLARIKTVMKADEDVSMSNLQFPRETLDHMDQQGNRPYQTNQMMGISPAPPGQSPQTTGLVSSGQSPQLTGLVSSAQMAQHNQQQQQTFQQELPNIWEIEQVTDFQTATSEFFQQQQQQQLQNFSANQTNQMMGTSPALAGQSPPTTGLPSSAQMAQHQLAYQHIHQQQQQLQNFWANQTKQMMGTSPAPAGQYPQTTGLTSSAQMAQHHEQQQQTLQQDLQNIWEIEQVTDFQTSEFFQQQQQQQLQNFLANQTNQMMGTFPASAGQSPQTTGLPSSAEMAQHQLAYQPIHQQQQQQQLQNFWANQTNQTNQMMGTSPAPAGQSPQTTGLPSSAEIAQDQLAYQQIHQQQQQQQLQNFWSLWSNYHQTTGLAPSAQMAQHQFAYQHRHQQQQQELPEQLQQQLKKFWEDQYKEIEQVTDFKNPRISLASIKKIMKQDGDVRMISAEAPILLSRACEMFTHDLVIRAWPNAVEKNRRALEKQDVAAVIRSTGRFDFLDDVVSKDLIEDEMPASIPGGTLPAEAPAGGVPALDIPAQSAPQVGASAMQVDEPVDQQPPP